MNPLPDSRAYNATFLALPQLSLLLEVGLLFENKVVSMLNLIIQMFLPPLADMPIRKFDVSWLKRGRQSALGKAIRMLLLHRPM